MNKRYYETWHSGEKKTITLREYQAIELFYKLTFFL